MLLDDTFSFIVNKLNQHFRVIQGALDEDRVVMSNIVNQQGEVESFEENKVVCTLIGLEKEGTVNRQYYYRQISDEQTMLANPPLSLNLYMLFSVHYSQSNYIESLKSLSYLISFFQSNHIFRSATYPELPSSIDMLSFEIFDQNQFDRSQMWSMIGAKYVPSIVYKVRMLTFDNESIQRMDPVADDVQPNVNSIRE